MRTNRKILGAVKFHEERERYREQRPGCQRMRYLTASELHEWFKSIDAAAAKLAKRSRLRVVR
jgi:hypothetical protein